MDYSAVTATTGSTDGPKTRKSLQSGIEPLTPEDLIEISDLLTYDTDIQ